MTKLLLKSNRIALALFFLVGACGFVYEIVWVHLIGLKMEYTAYSQLMTLTIFIAGIALGGLISSRYADHLTNPLKVFSLLALLISFIALLSPLVISLTEPLSGLIYRGYGASFYMVHIMRFALCGLILLFPAGVIGATLPVLISYSVRKGRGVGFAGASLYGWGGLGAACGTILSGFFLIPLLGYHGTLYLVIVVNAAFALMVLRISYREEQGASDEEPFLERATEPVEKTVLYREVGAKKNLLLLLLLLAAFFGTVYEISMLRALVLIFDSTIHTLGVILSASILSISLGSLLSPLLRERAKDHFFVIAMMLLLLAVSMLAGVLVISLLPVPAVKAAIFYQDSFIMYRFVQFLLVLCVLLLPCMIVGAVFGLGGGIYMRSVRSAGHDIGIIYIINVAGVMVGFLIGAFVMFSLFGIRGTVLIVTLMSILTSITLLYFTRLSVIVRYAVTVGAVLILPPLFVFVPIWESAAMTSGASVYAGEYFDKGLDSEAIIREIKRKNSVLYYKEGSVSTVSVVKSDDGTLSLKVDGGTEASTRGTSLVVQELLSDLALMFHEDPKEVLLVGLGSGVSLDAVTSHPVTSIDCVEVSREVVEASEYFRRVNEEAILDSRVNFIPVDGRTHLGFSDKKYDVIISTPSEPWVYGFAAFFTREYFEEARRSLNDKGIMVQRINGNRLSEYGFKVILRTFLEIYPHATLWEIDSRGGEYLLMGSLEKLELDYGRMKERMEVERVIHDLEMSGITELPTLLTFFAKDESRLRVYTKGAAVNTDDNALLEFSAAKDVLKAVTSPIRHNIEDFRTPPLAILTNIEEGQLDDVTSAYMAATFIRKAETLTEGGRAEEALRELDRALFVMQGSRDIARLVARQYVYIGRLSEDLNFSLEVFSKAVALNPAEEEGLYFLGSVYYFMENYDEAIDVYKKAVKVNPRSSRNHEALAFSYQARGDTDIANEEYELSERLRSTSDVVR